VVLGRKKQPEVNIKLLHPVQQPSASHNTGCKLGAADRVAVSREYVWFVTGAVLFEGHLAANTALATAEDVVAFDDNTAVSLQADLPSLLLLLLCMPAAVARLQAHLEGEAAHGRTDAQLQPG
jgi:hypothetical protein